MGRVMHTCHLARNELEHCFMLYFHLCVIYPIYQLIITWNLRYIHGGFLVWIIRPTYPFHYDLKWIYSRKWHFLMWILFIHSFIYFMYGCVRGIPYSFYYLLGVFWLPGFWWPRSRIRGRGARVWSGHRSDRLPVFPRFPGVLVLPTRHHFEVVVPVIWCIPFCFVRSICLYSFCGIIYISYCTLDIYSYGFVSAFMYLFVWFGLDVHVDYVIIYLCFVM